MSYTCITTFITVGDSKYQNSTIGQTIDGHQYLSFIYQGGAKNRSGDNIEAAIVLSANLISMNAARAAVVEKQKVKVETFVMNSTFTSKQRKLTQENWIAASMSYDTETIEVLLSSAIDAVGASTPNRVLTRLQVGELPVTGSVNNR
mgnify:FL=1|jgi:hypothetical protein|tara:strand:- start:1244 stop:1684 length:441 start_codon:yes stop_codon:yes gene_type:complete